MRSKYCPIHPCVEDIGGTITVRLLVLRAMESWAGPVNETTWEGLGMMLVWVCCTD